MLYAIILLNTGLVLFINSVTARVKIIQNVDILAKVHVYLVHWKVEHCQPLRAVSTFTGQN